MKFIVLHLIMDNVIKKKLRVAQRVSQLLGATAHKVLDVSLLNELAISSLTRDNIPVPDF